MHGILTSLINTLGMLLKSLAEIVTEWCCSWVIGSSPDALGSVEFFRPTFGFFKYALWGGGTILNTNMDPTYIEQNHPKNVEMGEYNLNVITTHIMRLAYIIMITIIVVQIMALIFTTVYELKIDMVSLLMRIVFSLLAIIFAVRIGTFVMDDIGNGMFNSVLTGIGFHDEEGGKIVGLQGNGAGGTSAANTWYTNYDPGNEDNAWYEDIGSNVGAGIGNFLGEVVMLLVGLIVNLGCMWQVIKLTGEVVQHYITCCCLVMCSPISGAFLAGEESSKAFFTYWKMLLVEIAMLVISRLWLLLGLNMMWTMVANSLPVYIAFFAFLRVGNSIPQVARSLGLSTSGLAGSLANSIAASGIGTMMVLRNIGNFGGKSLTNVGSATNKAGLVTAGNFLLGRGTSVGAVQDTMHNNIFGRGAQALAKARGKDNFTPSMERNLRECLANNTAQSQAEAAKIFENLSPAGQRAALEKMTAMNSFDGFKKAAEENGLNAELMNLNGRGQIDAQLTDKNGNIVATGNISAFNPLGQGIPILNSDGSTKYFVPDDPTKSKMTQPIGSGREWKLNDKMVFNGMSGPELAGANVKKLIPSLFDEQGKLKPSADVSKWAIRQDARGKFSAVRTDQTGGYNSWQNRGVVSGQGIHGLTKPGSTSEAKVRFTQNADGTWKLNQSQPLVGNVNHRATMAMQAAGYTNGSQLKGMSVRSVNGENHLVANIGKNQSYGSLPASVGSNAMSGATVSASDMKLRRGPNGSMSITSSDGKTNYGTIGKNLQDNLAAAGYKSGSTLDGVSMKMTDSGNISLQGANGQTLGYIGSGTMAGSGMMLSSMSDGMHITSTDGKTDYGTLNAAQQSAFASIGYTSGSSLEGLTFSSNPDGGVSCYTSSGNEFATLASRYVDPGSGSAGDVLASTESLSGNAASDIISSSFNNHALSSCYLDTASDGSVHLKSFDGADYGEISDDTADAFEAAGYKIGNGIEPGNALTGVTLTPNSDGGYSAASFEREYDFGRCSESISDAAGENRNLDNWTCRLTGEGNTTSFALYSSEEADLGSYNKDDFSFDIAGPAGDGYDGNVRFVRSNDGRINLQTYGPSEDMSAPILMATQNEKGEVTYAGTQWLEARESNDMNVETDIVEERVPATTAFMAEFYRKDETFEAKDADGKIREYTAQRDGILSQSGMKPTEISCESDYSTFHFKTDKGENMGATFYVGHEAASKEFTNKPMYYQGSANTGDVAVYKEKRSQNEDGMTAGMSAQSEIEIDRQRQSKSDRQETAEYMRNQNGSGYRRNKNRRKPL